jgi:hypothetical protein
VPTMCAGPPLMRGAMLAWHGSATACSGLRQGSRSGSCRWRLSVYGGSAVAGVLNEAAADLSIEADSGQRGHKTARLAIANAPPLLNAQLASTAVSATGGCVLCGSARVGPSLPRGPQVRLMLLIELGDPSYRTTITRAVWRIQASSTPPATIDF